MERPEHMRIILHGLLLLLPVLTMAQGYMEQFPLRQQTKNFEFHYKRNPERIATIARFADGFITVLNRDFFKVEFDFPINVLVLEDRPAFHTFLRREFHISDPPNFGMCAKTAPREAIVEKRKQTDTLPGLISRLRSILRRQLDRQMTMFKRTNAEFYAGYLAARVIVDRGGSSPTPPTPPPAPPGH